MLLKCKGWDKVIAITDSIMAAGLPDGNYKLGVNDVVVKDGDAVLASNGVRAGSTLTLAQALKNIVKFTDHPVQDVIPLMTINPAKALRMDERKGSIEVGKDADMALLDDIVRHNRQDVATLSTLLVRLCRIYDRPETLTERRDLFSIGKALEKQGELGPARELYRVSAIPSSAGTLAALSGERVAGMANWQLYLLARKNRNYEEMRAVLEQMLSRRQMPFEANIELSKWYEHHAGDCARALEYAQAAQKQCPPEQAEAVERRVDRLLRKTEPSNLEE